MDKKIHKIWKRTLSILMTFLLTAGLALSNLSVAYADGTELPDDKLPVSGACEGTAFKWKSNWAFDMCGLKARQTEYSGDGIKTTYSWAGYETYIQFGGDDNGNSKIAVSIPGNGGVKVDTSNKVEIKMSLSHSTDNKYILVDYYVYDTSGEGGTNGRTVRLGSCADVMISDDDGAAIYKNSRGFHMVNGNAGKETFDCITKDDEKGTLGVTAPTTRWIGKYDKRYSNIFKNSDADSIVPPPGAPHAGGSQYDSGLAYSWKFQLHPYEMVHKRVAFAIRDTTYYVSYLHGEDGGKADGTYSKPFKSIEYALGKIGNKKGYIYIMDYTDITNTISIAGASADITIASTDYDGQGNPVGEIKTLKRAASSEQSMFKVPDGAILRLTDITLDGNGIASANPLLSVDSGRLEINSDATVTNCHGSAQSNGSAINITGTGSLSMNMGHVTGNTSEGKGAIYFDSSESFNVQNEVQINSNVNGNGVASNVYLAGGKYITVDGDLGSSKIGVTTAALPTVSAEGAATAADQEITIAKPDTKYSVDPPCPFVDNFTADQKDANSVYIYPGTVSDKAEAHLPTGNDKNAVLRRNGQQISCVLKDAAGLSIPNASYGPFMCGVGEQVDVPPPLPASPANADDPLKGLAGYTLDKVDIDQPTGGGLQVGGNPGDDGYGRITGAMPNQDVTVEYTYKKGKSVIEFVTNGATQQPDSLKGTAGDPVSSLLPSVTKYGYKFWCWSKTNDFVDPDEITSLPTTFPEEPKTTYYAIFKPDSDQSFTATVNHTNMSGTIAFGAPKTVSGMVETSITDTQRNVKGYAWSKDDSDTLPAKYNYTGALENVGTFDDHGNYSGKMPGQDTTVNYRYKVDASQPKLALKVNYQSTDDPPVNLVTEPEQSLYPEEPINLMPEEIYGYKCVGYKIVSPNKTGQLPDNGGYVYSFEPTEEPSEANHFAVKGLMPNQPVELTYLYETTIPGYEMTVSYVDSDTQDDNLSNIADPIKTGPHKAGSAVGGSEGGAYEQPYGYMQSYAQEVKPDGAEIQVAPDSLQWGGTMPNNDARVTYKHHRDNSKWVTVTYKPGAQQVGTLHNGNGVSQDVSASGDDFTAKILKQSDGHDGYTLQQIIDKKLMPKAVLNTGEDKYYQFDPVKGWFVDTNTDGLLNSGETLLPPDYQFTDDATVTAYYGEKPGAWVTINYKAGSRVTIADNQPKSYHAKFDTTWANIPANQKPEYHWQPNYLDDGWWVNGKPLDPNAALVNGDYIAQCRPDPAIFGTTVRTPNASARLNTDGRGRITVYGIIESYQYILVDAQGKVQAVETGMPLSDRVEFDNLYPGAHYTVYEALGSVHIQPGDTFDSSILDISEGADVLVPVLDTNYRIKYDHGNEGKTVLHIEPADRQSDYAVLDSNGHVVRTPETDSDGWQRPSGNPGKMDFTGLDYNVEYTVVARPAGQAEIQAEPLREDGSVVTTDPGGELLLTNYIIETPHGSIESVNNGTEVGTDRYDEAHKGMQVKINADEEDGSGTFDHWEFTIGSVDGLPREVGNRNERELEFTMPDTNLVITAIYKYPGTASPSNATVTDEVRGGSREEMALDPDEVGSLEEQLTTPEDETLMDLNQQRVSYKVVYRKNAVRATESEAIKQEPPYSEHLDAYKGAWGLDVSVERYVNGRKVGVASPANASFNTYVQLDKDDVDMLDYNLFRVEEDPDNHDMTFIPVIDMNYDPETTGGLFTFTATAGCRYVMVYSRAYRMNFRNEIVPANEQETTSESFKVRRKETPDADELRAAQDAVGATAYFVGPNGAEYNFDGWSYRDLPADKELTHEFDPDKKVTRKTDVYAHYFANVSGVNDARKKLEDAVKAAISLSDDHFLKVHESDILKGFIATAQSVLDNPQALEADLNEAFDVLEASIAPWKDTLKDRYDHYDDIQNSSHSGGSHGGGGGGAGTRKNPYNDISPNDYQIGTNGNWVETIGPNGEKQMSFQLNGGSKLTGMWAKLEYPAGTDAAGNGWYHFDSKGAMQTGWVCDPTGNWYYCNTEKDGYAGKMATDWKMDSSDGHWYYLDPASGAMALGWRQIGGKWYYFSPVGGGTYAYDPAKENWTYGGGIGRPMGSMYKNETTPDGYQVGPDGAWVQ